MTAKCCALAAAFLFSTMTPSGLVFHAPLDKGPDALHARGSGKANTDGKAKLVPGKSGNGIELGTKDAYLTYPTQGNLDLMKGSVAMWVKPVGFSPTKDADCEWDQYDLFRIVTRSKPHSDEMRFRIQRVNRKRSRRGVIELITAPADPDGLGGSGKRVYVTAKLKAHPDRVLIPWPEGEFKHVAATWDYEQGRIAVFLDGKQVAVTEKESLKKRFVRPDISFTIGPYKGTMLPDGVKGSDVKKVVIDDVKIYDRPLSVAEAANLARGIPQTK